MAEWKKRLTDEDARVLGAEIKEATTKAGRGGTKTLAALAGVNPSMLHHITSGASNSTVPTALRIRNAIRTLAERGPQPLALPPAAKSRASSSAQGRYSNLTAEQEPLRVRLRAVMQREGLSQSDVGRAAGMHSSTLSAFLVGKSLQAKNVERLMNGLTALDRNPKPAKQQPRAAMVQHRLPLNGINGHSNGAGQLRRQIDVVAARFQTIHEAAPPSDAVALAQSFIQRTGLEAIETLLRIAKSNQTDGE